MFVPIIRIRDSWLKAHDCQQASRDMTSMLLELCLIWTLCAEVCCVLLGIWTVNTAINWLGEEFMVESIIEAVGLSVWKYSYRLTERCTSLFIGLLQKKKLSAL